MVIFEADRIRLKRGGSLGDDLAQFTTLGGSARGLRAHLYLDLTQVLPVQPIAQFPGSGLSC